MVAKRPLTLGYRCFFLSVCFIIRRYLEVEVLVNHHHHHLLLSIHRTAKGNCISDFDFSKSFRACPVTIIISYPPSPNPCIDIKTYCTTNLGHTATMVDPNLDEALTAEKTIEIPTSSDSATLPGDKESTDMPSLEAAIPAFKPSRGFLLAFTSICIITLAAALDATSLSIALPIITEKLKGTAIEAFWSGTSFLLTSAVFQPVIAGLSHVFGRKQVLLS
jgi:hypothetical protein